MKLYYNMTCGVENNGVWGNSPQRMRIWVASFLVSALESMRNDLLEYMQTSVRPLLANVWIQGSPLSPQWALRVLPAAKYLAWKHKRKEVAVYNCHTGIKSLASGPSKLIVQLVQGKEKNTPLVTDNLEKSTQSQAPKVPWRIWVCSF